MAVTINASTSAGLINTADTSGILQLQTANTTALTIDASQNVGLGVTPAAWTSNHEVFQFGATGVLANNTSQFTTLATNYYNASGGDTYIANGFATRYYQLSGQHVWNTAPSGTAGNTITFTQAMTLDASGNLGVGTTSMSYPLTRNGITLKAKGADGVEFVMQSSADTGQDGFVIVRSGANAGLNNRTNGSLEFATNNTERARIDSSGSFLVGNTSNPNTARIYVRYDSLSTQPIINGATVVAASSSWNHFIGQSGNGSSITTNNIFILGNGNVQNANNSYGAISDIKLKENIVDASPKLDKLMQVRIRNYNLKGDYEQHKQLGVVAQELETVFPSMVDETPDRDAEGNDLGTTTKAVKYSVFVPMLIKAIQEQQALITQLQADVAALKGA